MEIVLNIILPVFGVLLLGYGAAWAGLFDAAANRGLSLFAFNFAIPLLLFRSMAHADLPEAMPWGFLASYYIGAFIVFGLGMGVGRLFSRRLDEWGVLGLSSAFSNVGMVGIPLVLTAFGDTAALPLFLLMSFHSLLLLPTATTVIEIGRGQKGALREIPWNALKGLVANPLVPALAAGFAFSLSGLAVPKPVDAIAAALGDAAGPCALFAMGGTLRQHRISGNRVEISALVTIKLLLHPLLVWVLGTWVFTMAPLWTHVAVVMAALPAGVTSYLFAQRYQACLPTAISTVFLSTLLSILSLSFLLYQFSLRYSSVISSLPEKP
ncbi:MAG: AEC family transporter [Candidatus Competibacteraceae bacterium]|nr:AEC family transporter [Candidatus Competibacteraceae bacterium]